MSFIMLQGTAPPTVTPDFIGQEFDDTLAKITYRAYGTASSADWQAPGSGGGGIYPGAFNDLGQITPSVAIAMDAADTFNRIEVGDNAVIVNFTNPIDQSKAYYKLVRFEDFSGFTAPVIQKDGTTITPIGSPSSSGLLEVRYWAGEFRAEWLATTN